MNEIKEYTEKIFEDIKHTDEKDNEYCFINYIIKILPFAVFQ